jgi:hypothetical protein
MFTSSLFIWMSELIEMQNFYLDINVPHCHLFISSASGINVYFSFHVYTAIKVRNFSYLLTSMASSRMFLQIFVATQNY